jgi:hypothetical protein
MAFPAFALGLKWRGGSGLARHVVGISMPWREQAQSKGWACQWQWRRRRGIEPAPAHAHPAAVRHSLRGSCGFATRALREPKMALSTVDQQGVPRRLGSFLAPASFCIPSLGNEGTANEPPNGRQVSQALKACSQGMPAGTRALAIVAGVFVPCHVQAADADKTAPATDDSTAP